MRLYELEIISNVVLNGKAKNSNTIKKLFDLDNIQVEEFVNEKTNKHVKKYSLIYENNICYKVNKSYEDLKDVILNKSIPVLGFADKFKSKQNIKKGK